MLWGYIWFSLFSLKYSLFSHIHIINKESFALTGHTSPAYFHFAAQTYIYLFIAIKSAFLILLKNWSVTLSLPQFIQQDWYIGFDFCAQYWLIIQGTLETDEQ